MRIEGYIEHPVFKITVMRMSHRFTVKFEFKSLEQTYKFRENDFIRGMADIKQLIDEDFINEVGQTFKRMQNLQVRKLEDLLDNKGLEFPNII